MIVGFCTSPRRERTAASFCGRVRDRLQRAFLPRAIMICLRTAGQNNENSIIAWALPR
jgi:hypothetical protein